MGVQQPYPDQSAAPFRAPRAVVPIPADASDTVLCLLCRANEQGCVLPLSQVVETMRPLPTIAIPGAPPFVRGLAIIRGLPTPVVDLARLLGGTMGTATRFVSLKSEQGTLALAVEHVEGLRHIALNTLQPLPSLLQSVQSDAIAAVTLLDEQLLLLMRTAQLVPEAMWAAITLEAGGRS
jgi:purine-binding chemotaxis protein CheW